MTDTTKTTPRQRDLFNSPSEKGQVVERSHRVYYKPEGKNNAYRGNALIVTYPPIRSRCDMTAMIAGELRRKRRTKSGDQSPSGRLRRTEPMKNSKIVAWSRCGRFSSSCCNLHSPRSLDGSVKSDATDLSKDSNVGDVAPVVAPPDH